VEVFATVEGSCLLFTSILSSDVKAKRADREIERSQASAYAITVCEGGMGWLVLELGSALDAVLYFLRLPDF
jgi:hypothetical protein